MQHTLMGIDVVVWWSEPAQAWAVLRDACPHRMAQLSQGRVQNGSLVCSYHVRAQCVRRTLLCPSPDPDTHTRHNRWPALHRHAAQGWHFDAKGSCTKIPQARRPSGSRSAGARYNRRRPHQQSRCALPVACTRPQMTAEAQAPFLGARRTCAQQFPVLQEEGLLYVWLDTSPEVMGAASFGLRRPQRVKPLPPAPTALPCSSAAGPPAALAVVCTACRGGSWVRPAGQGQRRPCRARLSPRAVQGLALSQQRGVAKAPGPDFSPTMWLDFTLPVDFRHVLFNMFDPSHGDFVHHGCECGD